MDDFLKWLNAEPRRRTLLAERLGLHRSTITQWLRRNSIPFWQVMRVEQITGVPRWKLKPAFFAEPTDGN